MSKCKDIGVAVLVKNKNISMTPQDIREALAYTALDLGGGGRDNSYGFGFVQAS